MNPVYVAIDTPDLEHALELAAAVRQEAGGIKLGLEFFAANGPSGVARMAELDLPVFLDLKFHDIPNTVEKAIKAIGPLQPAVLTVHAAGGRAMLEAARAAAPTSTRVVGVTVLTSLDPADLRSIGVANDSEAQVNRLASLSRTAGLDGIVCSGMEVGNVSSAWPGGFFVVPGVRPRGSNTGDQKRVVTPNQALADGASILVIGRPVTGAADPRQALREIVHSLELRHA